MKKVAVITDSNSGITQSEAKKLGIHVVPMPFFVNGDTFYEDISMSQDEFYGYLAQGADVMTSQPAPDTLMKLWDSVLECYDEIVYIPMSSGLSSSCGTAMMLSYEEKYENKVFVVDNQRISVTQKQSVFDAIRLAESGKSGKEIKDILEDAKFQSSIYIMVDTLYYLKKGGRITPAAAALGTLLKLKPVLQIQGEKLDAFAKARTVKQAKSIMIKAVKDDYASRFKECQDEMQLCIAYTGDISAAMEFHKEVEAEFGITDIMMDPLSLNVSCHIGPGALALACARKL